MARQRAGKPVPQFFSGRENSGEGLAAGGVEEFSASIFHSALLFTLFYENLRMCIRVSACVMAIICSRFVFCVGAPRYLILPHPPDIARHMSEENVRQG